MFLMLLMRFLPPIAISVGLTTGFKFSVGKETAALQELDGLRADRQSLEAQVNQLEVDKKKLTRQLAAVVPTTASPASASTSTPSPPFQLESGVSPEVAGEPERAERYVS